VLAVIKGYRNGFVIAVFSFLGIFIGLAAAMKLSTLVAGWLQDSTHIAAAWLPFLSFLLIMIGVILLVRLGALFIQTAMEAVLMGWINKLSGVVLYAALYTTILSVVLFYAEKIHWIKPDTFTASRTFAYIQPWGPKALEWFGKIVPWFKGMFDELSVFFEKLSRQIN
jgi:membrane protein required for colicin V production